MTSPASAPATPTLAERLEGRIARLTSRIPSTWLLRLIGEQPVVIDGRTLDPHVQFVLAATRRQLAMMNALRPLLSLSFVRAVLRRAVKPGPTAAQREKTVTHVWGEARDAAGRTVSARLHGPEAGVEWTVRCALATVARVIGGDAPPGYQTPAMAYGADFVLACDGVTREDVESLS